MNNDLQGVVLVRAFVDLFGGDINTALILSQMAYWHGWCVKGKSKLRVLHEGTYWLAKSAVDWSNEIGMTDKQAERCIKVLLEKGLIRKMVKKFNGSPTVHTQLTSAGEAVLKNPSGNFHLPSKEIGFPPEGKSLTESTTKNTTETTTDSAGKPADPVGEEIEIQKQIGKGDVEEAYKNGGKLESALVKHWREQMAISYPTYNKLPLTKINYGQLKQFGNKMGSKADEAVTFAVQNWFKFTLSAMQDKGASSVPGTPVIGFLLKYCDVLLKLMDEMSMQEIQKAELEAEEKTEAQGNAQAKVDKIIEYKHGSPKATEEDKLANHKLYLEYLAQKDKEKQEGLMVAVQKH